MICLFVFLELWQSSQQKIPWWGIDLCHSNHWSIDRNLLALQTFQLRSLLISSWLLSKKLQKEISPNKFKRIILRSRKRLKTYMVWETNLYIKVGFLLMLLLGCCFHLHQWGKRLGIKGQPHLFSSTFLFLICVASQLKTRTTLKVVLCGVYCQKTLTCFSQWLGFVHSWGLC